MAVREFYAVVRDLLDERVALYLEPVGGFDWQFVASIGGKWFHYVIDLDSEAAAAAGAIEDNFKRAGVLS